MARPRDLLSPPGRAIAARSCADAKLAHRSRGPAIAVLIAASCLLGSSPLRGQNESAAAPGLEGPRIEVRLLTGGTVKGLLMDSDEGAVVVFSRETPFVIAYSEMDSGSAYRVKKQLLSGDAGLREPLTAAQHMELGRYVLNRGNLPLAIQEFNLAKSLNPSLASCVQALLDAQRDALKKAQPASAEDDDPGSTTPPQAMGERPAPPAPSEAPLVPFISIPGAEALRDLTPGQRLRICDTYRSYYAPKWEALFGDLPIIAESSHFLLFTDLDPIRQGRLLEAAEDMFDTLAQLFGFTADQQVFLGRCPVFALRSKARFLRFARAFDQYGDFSALGYTRSIEEKGYVHISLYAPGTSEVDFDQMVQTLVHEGTHAFLHRVPPYGLIPHWVNEGLAEWVCEKVLGDRSPAGEKAELLAGLYVRKDWPITNLLTGRGPIEVQQYALSHSVVGFLLARSRDVFADFLRQLKTGVATEEALKGSYGSTLKDLEREWREAVRSAEAAEHPGNAPPPPLPTSP